MAVSLQMRLVPYNGLVGPQVYTAHIPYFTGFGFIVIPLKAWNGGFWEDKTWKKLRFLITFDWPNNAHPMWDSKVNENITGNNFGQWYKVKRWKNEDKIIQNLQIQSYSSVDFYSTYDFTPSFYSTPPFKSLILREQGGSRSKSQILMA